MRRSPFVPTLLLSVALACGSPDAPVLAPKPPPAVAAPTPAPPSACPTPPALPPPWVPAAPDDFVPMAAAAARATDRACPAIRADFDGDGRIDIATLAVDRPGRRAALVFVPATGDPRVITTMAAPPGEAPADERLVTTPLALKPAGKAVVREYLADAAQLTAPAAMELCGAPDGAALTESLVCYCSTWYWVAADGVHSLMACD